MQQVQFRCMQQIQFRCMQQVQVSCMQQLKQHFTFLLFNLLKQANEMLFSQQLPLNLILHSVKRILYKNTSLQFEATN